MKIVILSVVALVLLGCVNPTGVSTDDVVKYEEGRAHYSSDEYHDAIADFQELVSDYPWSSKVDNALEYWGKSLLKLADADESALLYDSAYEVFSRIPEKSSGYVEAQYYAGEALLGSFEDEGDISRSTVVTQFYSVYRNWPKNSYAEKSIKEIVSLFLEEELEDSASYYASLIGMTIDDSLIAEEKAIYSSARALYISATKSDLTADYDKAISALIAYQDGATNDSLSAEAGFYIAKSYYRSSRYEEALPWIETTLQSEDVSRETLEEALYRKGYSLHVLDRISEAKEALESYADSYEDGAYELYSWRYLGEVTLALADTASALEWFDKVVDKDSLCSSDEAALFTLGEIHYKQDDYSDTRERLELYLERYPTASLSDAANSYRMIGHSYRKQEALPQALQWFEDGLAKDEFKAGTYYDNLLYWAGAVAYDLAQIEKAKGYLEMYIQEFPNGSYKSSAESTLAKIDGGY